MPVHTWLAELVIGAVEVGQRGAPGGGADYGLADYDGVVTAWVEFDQTALYKRDYVLEDRCAGFALAVLDAGEAVAAGAGEVVREIALMVRQEMDTECFAVGDRREGFGLVIHTNQELGRVQ